MEIKYSPADYDLVDDWADKWLDLIDLINQVTGTDEASQSPPPPTVFEELQYNSLRSWLVNHQEQFVPLWAFFQSHIGFKMGNVGEDADFPQKYNDNPFMYFYEPENLYRLAEQLELQSGIDIWEPNEHIASMVRPVIIRLGQLMVEFLDWIAINDSCKEAYMHFDGTEDFLRLQLAVKKISNNNLEWFFKALLERDLPEDDGYTTGEIGILAINLVILREEVNKIKDLCDGCVKLIDEVGNQMH